MNDDIRLNDVLAFFLEIGTLVLVGMAVSRLPLAPVGRAGLTVLVLCAALVLWALFAAPKARFGRPGPAVGVKMLVLGGGAVAGFVVLPAVFALGWAVFAVVNTGVTYVRPPARGLTV